MEACWIENYLTGEFQGLGKLGAVAKGNSGLNSSFVRRSPAISARPSPGDPDPFLRRAKSLSHLTHMAAATTAGGSDQISENRPIVMNVGAYGRHGPPCVHDHDLPSFHGNDHGHAGGNVCGCD